MKRFYLVFLIVLSIVISPGLAISNSPAIEKDPVEMVPIPVGPFIRGSAQGEGRPDEQPRQKIYLDAFAIDKYEVTNSRYLKFVKETLHKAPFNVYGDGSIKEVSNIADLPVVQVTWHDAVDYCFWAGKRLPTEAEWEKAARGQDGRRYPWGNDLGDKAQANYDREWESHQTFSPVSSHPGGQSPYGIYHLSGNVREWVQDWYGRDYYQIAPSRNPRGPEMGILKVIRGGSWRSFESDIRTTARGKGGFALKTHGIGFRCARNHDLVQQSDALGAQ
ncbi:MAG: SUMF1/EgtB/PvdO family nonheme iron enzyme [Nitrospirales bacterium]|nr:SUMF1/EgtB/PvdO family nonheme iron enzyme [Nitrospirales bacterium]